MSPSNEAVIDRFLAQVNAFQDITVRCTRCKEHAPLEQIVPTHRGLMCEHCTSTMSNMEFEWLEAQVEEHDG